MKKAIFVILVLIFSRVNAQNWNTNGNNSTTGNVSAKEYNFPLVRYDFSKKPRTQLRHMSIKLFDDYITWRPGGNSPDNNSYGTLLSINGFTSHWESNIYFGANTKKMYFRTSTWNGGIAENGVKGDFHRWRTLLDSESDVKTNKNIKVSGSGTHYISNGNLGIGTDNPLHGKLQIKGNGPSEGLVFWSDQGDPTTRLWTDPTRRLFHISRTSSTEKGLTIDNNGNIGIGTTSPSTKLEVNGTSKSNRLIVSTTKDHIPLVQLFDSTNNIDWNIENGRTNVGDLGFYNDGTKMLIKSNGNVGLGTINPTGNLHVQGETTPTIVLSDKINRAKLQIGIATGNGNFDSFSKQNDAIMRLLGGGDLIFNIPGNNSNRKIAFHTATDKILTIQEVGESGKVGVGTTNFPETIGGKDIRNYKLFVKGGIFTEEVRVQTGWADFVFEKNYNLPSLQDVEDYIKDKGHLKDIPSAKEVENKGVFLGEISAKLLQKIEELTLYTIQQQKNLEFQKNEIKQLRNENKVLTSLLERITKLEKKLEIKN